MSEYSFKYISVSAIETVVDFNTISRVTTVDSFFYVTL